jgi:hypothetical protein
VKKLAGVLSVFALCLTALTLLTASPAAAASVCATGNTLSSSQSTVAGGATVTLTANLKDCAGAGVAGVQANFSQGAGPCPSTISSKTAMTNSQGTAATQVTLPTNCPGQYVFNVAADGGVLAATTVTVTGGFPFTGATAPDQRFPSEGLLLLIGGLVLAAAGTLFWRARSRA